ncbi:MAG: hypothetical protein N2662_06985 [Bacteroidales bacterium]|nr:hypothetical protein [Bacteroidales bacterium]
MDKDNVQQWLSNKLKPLNKFWIGFILGVIAPIATLTITYFVNFEKYSIEEFYTFLVQFRILTKLLSLCVLPNLGIFFLFLYPDFRRAAMGTLMATFVVAIAIIVTQAFMGLLW